MVNPKLAALERKQKAAWDRGDIRTVDRIGFKIARLHGDDLKSETDDHRHKPFMWEPK